MGFTWNFLVFSMVLMTTTCTSADNTLFTSSFHRDINPSPVETISRADVVAFFNRFGEGNVTRCRFMRVLVDAYHFDSLRTSVLFDVVQTSRGDVMSQEEFIGAMLINSPVLSYDAFMDRLDSVAGIVDNMLQRPFELYSGPNLYQRTDFRVEEIANSFDVNSDAILSRNEISTGMRSMDLDGDWGIRRCEFVDSMQRFRQHAVTSAKFYDVLFKSRDIAWADVDSDFLGRMMNRDRNGVVGRDEFVWFFDVENDLASGIPIESSPMLVGYGDKAGRCHINVLLTVLMVVLAAIQSGF